jgi:hypothetical protein
MDLLKYSLQRDELSELVEWRHLNLCMPLIYGLIDG